MPTVRVSHSDSSRYEMRVQTEYLILMANPPQTSCSCCLEVTVCLHSSVKLVSVNELEYSVVYVKIVM